MAAEILKGMGAIWSTAGFTYPAPESGGTALVTTPGATVTMKIQSIKYDLDGKTQEVTDENGDVAAIVFYGDTEKITIEGVVVGQANSNAITNNLLPNRGSNIVIADTTQTGLNGTTFMFVSGSQNRTSEGFATMSLNIERKGKTTLSTIT